MLHLRVLPGSCLQQQLTAEEGHREKTNTFYNHPGLAQPCSGLSPGPLAPGPALVSLLMSFLKELHSTTTAPFHLLQLLTFASVPCSPPGSSNAQALPTSSVQLTSQLPPGCLLLFWLFTRGSCSPVLGGEECLQSPQQSCRLMLASPAQHSPAS